MKKRAKVGSRYQNVGYLLIAPGFLIYTLFVLIPIIWTIGMSFTDYNLKTFSFVGLENYIHLFHDSVFLKSMLNTIIYSVITIPVTMVLALFLATLLNSKIKGKGFSEPCFICQIFFPWLRYLWHGCICLIRITVFLTVCWMLWDWGLWAG